MKSTTYSRTIELQVRAAALAQLGKRDLETFYEHGAWHVTDNATGAIWSAHDTTHGFSFEQVAAGDEDR